MAYIVESTNYVHEREPLLALSQTTKSRLHTSFQYHLLSCSINIPHLKHPGLLTRRESGITAIIRTIHMIMDFVLACHIRAAILACWHPEVASFWIGISATESPVPEQDC